uniref:MYM-type domain-containing protein n=1 Tax=viral metagenome TaxID=1070528 RepID=A0A6C0DAA9_9ZZZZ
MSEVNGAKVLKKRGRKPKNKGEEKPIIKEDPIDSEKEVIIAHLPITPDDIDANFDNNDIFIKPDKPKKKVVYDTSSENIKIDVISPTADSESRSSNGIYINKINIYNIEVKQDTKCWWCKNCFSTPNVILPEQYFENTFYCIGNFCSYNCVKAYNIDLNDNSSWKRESLINLMYHMTYSRFKNISPAPSWLILKEFGGFMSINEFRKNFETNNSEYLLLQPPLISRQMQIEESYKKNVQSLGGSLNKLDKIFYPDGMLALKRNKPVETSQLNLEKTMGLKRKVKI